MKNLMGIYSIENLITHDKYIGQSVNIIRRWNNHKSNAFNKKNKDYNKPLYKDMRSYGLLNFKLDIIEKIINPDLLRTRENYWINLLKPKYNLTQGIDYQVIIEKLTVKEAQEIQSILIKDVDGCITYKLLAEKYHVSRDTIQAINAGRIWKDNNLNYPLHISKYDFFHKDKQIAYCMFCGKRLFKDDTDDVCKNCYDLIISKTPRQELKQKIRNQSFLSIGREYGITERAIRKWCKKYSLPYKKQEIKGYTNEEWENI